MQDLFSHQTPSGHFVALIGDMVSSRSFSGEARADVQVMFNTVLNRLNRTYRSALSSQLTVTLGDEFQGLLHDAMVIPDILWEIQRQDSLPDFRFGVGFGRIDTKIPLKSINLDGPAFHQAREAIKQAKSKGIRGAVFLGFGSDFDVIANGIARLLDLEMERRSQRQLQVMDQLRKSESQTWIAAKMGLTPQAVHEHKKAAGWEAYRDGEDALRRLLVLGSTGATG